MFEISCYDKKHLQNIKNKYNIFNVFRYKANIYGKTTTPNKAGICYLRWLYATKKNTDTRKVEKTYQTE